MTSEDRVATQTLEIGSPIFRLVFQFVIQMKLISGQSQSDRKS